MRTLPDEIVVEIYLRLPPDEPACLVRASLASKLWLGILTGPRFSARYRDSHGAPPMLGFCRFLDHPGQKFDPSKPYFSTTRFGPRIPEDKGRGSSNYKVYDCRHGRLLLEHDPMTLVLCDPMTGCRREIHAELNLLRSAVLCAVTGCDHRACHKGPSLVVSVGLEDAAARFDEFFVRTWSSQTGQWSERCYCPDLPMYEVLLPKPSVLIGDALFFMILYPEENEENNDEYLIGFVIYHLGSSTLSVLRAPPLLGSDDICNGNYIHMAMEDGTLGFAHVDNSALYLYSRRTGSDAADEPWTQHTVIHLNKLLLIQNPCEHLQLLGSVEGRDIIFVSADNDVYEIDLKSLQCKKLWKNDGLHALIPYMSFYHPRGKAVIHSEACNRKLLEIKKILELDLDEAMATDTNPGPAEFDCRERHMTDQEMKDGSTNICFHSVGSDLTRTQELRETEQTMSVQKDPNRTRTSMREPATSLESGVLGKTRKSLASAEDTQQGK